MAEIGLTMYIGNAKKASASQQAIMAKHSGTMKAEVNQGNLKVTSQRTPGWTALLMGIEAHQEGRKEGEEIRTKRHGRWPRLH